MINDQMVIWFHSFVLSLNPLKGTCRPQATPVLRIGERGSSPEHSGLGGSKGKQRKTKEIRRFYRLFQQTLNINHIAI